MSTYYVTRLHGGFFVHSSHSLDEGGTVIIMLLFQMEGIETIGK